MSVRGEGTEDAAPRGADLGPAPSPHHLAPALARAQERRRAVAKVAGAVFARIPDALRGYLLQLQLALQAGGRGLDLHSGHVPSISVVQVKS